MASIHVDDTRYAGDESSQQLWDELHAKLKFGKQRKATDGWQKFCGRWERQDPQTLEMEYSMNEYTKAIPLVRTRPEEVRPQPPNMSSAFPVTTACDEAPSTSTTIPGSPSTACDEAHSTTTVIPGSSATACDEAPSTSTTILGSFHATE